MKSLSQQVAEARGEYFEYKKDLIWVDGGYRKPMYEHDASLFMMLFQELPLPDLYLFSVDNITATKQWVCNWTTEKYSDERNAKEIGTAICEAWLEAFKCKECAENHYNIDPKNPFNDKNVVIKCKTCQGTGSTFKKEKP